MVIFLIRDTTIVMLDLHIAPKIFLYPLFSSFVFFPYNREAKTYFATPSGNNIKVINDLDIV